MGLFNIGATMATTRRPWGINGLTNVGWRIDSLSDTKTGVNFALNPIAIVPKREDAELIVTTINEAAKKEANNAA